MGCEMRSDTKGFPQWLREDQQGMCDFLMSEMASQRSLTTAHHLRGCGSIAGTIPPRLLASNIYYRLAPRLVHALVRQQSRYDFHEKVEAIP